MLLMYILFALTFSTVLSALFADHIPEDRKGGTFIITFVLLMILAGAMDEWLLPALEVRKMAWPMVSALVVFGAVLVSSLALSIRLPRRLHQSVMVAHNHRFDPESTAFDLFIWVALLALGIIVMRRIGI